MHYLYLQADYCKEPLDALVYMKDHGIGIELSMLYEVFSAIYERKRLFSMTNKALLLGLTTSA